MNDIEFQKNYSAFIRNTNPVATQKKDAEDIKGQKKAGPDFKSLLSQKISASREIVISKHAQIRIDARQIEMTPQFLEQISKAVEGAREKGIKDALILSGRAAFIVNIPNSTMVTAMDGHELKENIITNIDGAVIITGPF